MKVTILDIANKTGFSVSTVSRVVSNKGYVKEETRNSILRAAKELGYQIHQSPPKKTNYSNVVLITCSDITVPVYTQYIFGIDSILSENNIYTFFMDSRFSQTREEDYIEYAIENGFAGVIMLTATPTTRLENLLYSANIPVISVNRYLKTVDTDIVCVDNYRGGYIATRHLIDSGHKRIAHLAGPISSSASSDRLAGFKDAMKDAGLKIYPDDIVHANNLQYEEGYNYGEFLSHNRNGITAVFANNDRLGRGLVDGLHANDISVPRDISIVCHDSSRDATSGRVQLTSVHFDPYQMGIEAGRILLDRMNNPDLPKKRLFYCPVLVERKSVQTI